MQCQSRVWSAVTICALAITIVATARPAGQTRPAIESVEGHDAAACGVVGAFRGWPSLARLRAELAAERDEPVGSGRLWHARSRSKSVAALIAQRAARKDVLYAEPNYILYADATPNDPR